VNMPKKEKKGRGGGGKETDNGDRKVYGRPRGRGGKTRKKKRPTVSRRRGP